MKKNWLKLNIDFGLSCSFLLHIIILALLSFNFLNHPPEPTFDRAISASLLPVKEIANVKEQIKTKAKGKKALPSKAVKNVISRRKTQNKPIQKPKK